MSHRFFCRKSSKVKKSTIFVGYDPETKTGHK